MSREAGNQSGCGQDRGFGRVSSVADVLSKSLHDPDPIALTSIVGRHLSSSRTERTWSRYWFAVLPLSSRSDRSAYAAAIGSWVTMIMVLPCC